MDNMRANEFLSELSYPGNIGMMEMAKFYQVATPEQKARMKELIASGNTARAWAYLQAVTKTKLQEGRSYPVICVDVQPEYAYYTEQNEAICKDIIHFVTKQTGPVLFFVNAEDTGVSADSIAFIKQYWENVDVEDWDDEDPSIVTNPINWSRFTIVDKGYGYLRAWMDQNIAPALIIKAIRMMYQEKVSDSRQLFGGEDSESYVHGMKDLLGPNYLVGMDDPISVNWTSVAQLKRFAGAYIVGGGRNECLREVELLMNAFNIPYKRIDSLIYG